MSSLVPSRDASSVVSTPQPLKLQSRLQSPAAKSPLSSPLTRREVSTVVSTPQSLSSWRPQWRRCSSGVEMTLETQPLGNGDDSKDFAEGSEDNKETTVET